MLSLGAILSIVAGIVAIIAAIVLSGTFTEWWGITSPKNSGPSSSSKSPSGSQPMLSGDKIQDAKWTLKKDFWSGLTESNWLTTLRNQGWAILNRSQVSKNEQKDWSSENNVSWDSSDGMTIRLSEATSDCCCSSEDPTGANAACGACSAQTTCSGQVESPLWFSPGDYIEIVAKVPKAEGVWPAIWLLGNDNSGWPSEGEIDIMEHGGWTNPADSEGYRWSDDAFFSTVHCCCCDNSADCAQSGGGNYGCNCAGGAGKRIAYGNKVPDGLENWNTYGCYWSKDANIIWMFLNGEFLGCEINDCDVSLIGGQPCAQAWGSPMRAIFNIAIGGSLGTDTGKKNWNSEWSDESLKIKSAKIWSNA